MTGNMRAPVRLTGAQETLLATLYAKALDNADAEPILGDGSATELMGRIDYDFERLAFMRRDRRMVPLRARKLDDWCRGFLQAHPDALVLHLGCGLDGRAARLTVPPEAVWVDIDRPDVIALRDQLFDSRPGHRTVAASVTEPGWVDAIAEVGRPVLVVAEGLTPYLPAAEGTAMLRAIVERFGHGEMLFDAARPWTRNIARWSRLVRVTGAELGWVVGDPRALERDVPGLHHIEEWSLLSGESRLGGGRRDRLVAAATRHPRSLKQAYRLLRYRVGELPEENQ